MQSTSGDQRFFTSTRGRIVTLLRRTDRTVDELAQAVNLTDNAVRVHLTALERDGLVQQRGMRRTTGKPSYTYELTTQAERLFPKAYDLVLQLLLDVLSERMAPEEVEGILREVGRRIAAQKEVQRNGVRTQLEAAVAVLNTLGGLAELEESRKGYSICGYRCPLFALVPSYPQVCRLTETLVTEIAGVPAKERCERGESVWCWFEVPLQGGQEKEG